LQSYRLVARDPQEPRFDRLWQEFDHLRGSDSVSGNAALVQQNENGNMKHIVTGALVFGEAWNGDRW